MTNETALLLIAGIENLTRVLEHNAKLIRQLTEASERLAGLHSGGRDVTPALRPN